MMMQWALSVILLLLVGVATTAADIIQLTSEEFYEMITTGQVDLIIDVRTETEWYEEGHIQNATHVDSLQVDLAAAADAEAALRDLSLWECRFCRVVVYCRSGVRAGQALDLLDQAGFEGQLYNGLGVSQWTAAGYPLYRTASKENWPCMMMDNTVDTAVSRQSANSNTAVCTVEELYQQHQMELDTARDLFLEQMKQHNATGYSFLLSVFCACPPAGYPWLVTAELQMMPLGIKDPNTTAPVAFVMNPQHHGVMGDTVLAASDTDKEDVLQKIEEDTDAGSLTVYSILDLYDKIQAAIDEQAYKIDVEYNLEWGYPETIHIDYDPQVAGEDFLAMVSNVTALDIMEAHYDQMDYNQDNDNDNNNNNNTASILPVGLQDDLNANYALWESMAPSEYYFSYHWVEGSSDPGNSGSVMRFPWSAHVQNGNVVSVTNARGEDITSRPDAGGRTMQALFDAVQDGLDGNPHWIDVTYNPTYGYPMDIWIDYDVERTDEELSVTVTYFGTTAP